MIKKIGVLTSGGDAPGMNAAIRAVTRTALNMGLEVYGIHDGYLGMYEDYIEKLHPRSVSEKMGHGGTFLGTARLSKFSDIEVRKVAINNLKKYGIDAIVAIGGDGTYRGALSLSQMGIPVVCVPGTIDNDIGGTDYTIGFDTALNTVVEAVDKLRDTSNSHRRCSIIEVMGRNSGDIAVWTSIATGAEVVISKETGLNMEEVLETIRDAAKVKRHAIIILAENIIPIEELAKIVSENTPFDARATVLGHVQRGGAPSARDRVLASEMGVRAVQALMNGDTHHCICDKKGEMVSIPIEVALSRDEEVKTLKKFEVFNLVK